MYIPCNNNLTTKGQPMLKKLVKYGNSTALVLDKAILELLNISEGAVVKLKTDGTSLTITPHEVTKIEQVSPTITSEDTLRAAAQDLTKKSLDSWGISQEEFDDSRKSIRSIQKKYQPAISQFLENLECQRELKLLAEKYQNNPSSPDFIKAAQAIKYKYAPQLAQYDKEMEEAQSSIKSSFSGYFSGGIVDAMGAIHQKYAQYTQKFAQLMAEDQDFQHESLLIAEKYQTDQNSTEYMQALQALKNKYVPELAEMDKEMALLAKMMESPDQKKSA